MSYHLKMLNSNKICILQRCHEHNCSTGRRVFGKYPVLECVVWRNYPNDLCALYFDKDQQTIVYILQDRT